MVVIVFVVVDDRWWWWTFELRKLTEEMHQRENMDECTNISVKDFFFFGS